MLSGVTAGAGIAGAHSRRLWAGWTAAASIAASGLWMAGLGLVTLARGGQLGPATLSAERTSVGPVIVAAVAVLFAAERLWPAEPRPARTRAHLVDACYMVVYAAAVPFVVLLDTGFALEVHRHARFLLLEREAALPRALAVVAVLAGIDALNWAAHAANHRFAAMWRFHALHHSQEQMSVFTTFRTHPLAHVSYIPALLPALVLQASGTVPSMALVAYGCLVAVPHANLRWGYGPLGRWVVSPAFHRVHHSRTPMGGRRAANFGFVLTVWDRLAGTAVLAGAGETVSTGIAGRPVPLEQHAASRRAVAGVVAAQLAQPFKLRSGLEVR